MKKIEIIEHNPEWSLWFKEEAAKLKSSLGDNCVNIYHIGSTAVPGLYAKPKIDIIAEVLSVPESHLPLQKIDYEFRGEFNIPMRHFFRKNNPHDINLHVYEKDNPDIELNILFRDFLINSLEAKAEYNQLKRSLLKKNKSHVKENSIFNGYNLGKDAFIRKILDKSGYNELSFRFCTHHAATTL
ncbi:MAG: GrpB family protein [Pseudomonadota bacterium]